MSPAKKKPELPEVDDAMKMSMSSRIDDIQPAAPQWPMTERQMQLPAHPMYGPRAYGPRTSLLTRLVFIVLSVACLGGLALAVVEIVRRLSGP